MIIFKDKRISILSSEINKQTLIQIWNKYIIDVLQTFICLDNNCAFFR